jgi:hypothetical protein
MLAELDELNELTWHADVQTRSEWRRAGLKVGAPFEEAARFGFAIFHELASHAVEHDLPMKPDY